MNKQNRVIVLFIIAAMTSTAIGCGNGSAKKRTHMNRGLDLNKATEETGVDATAAEDATVENATENTTVEPDAAATQLKSENLDAIDRDLRALTEEGTTIERNSLEDGVYTLTDVASSLHYIYKTEDMRALQKLALNELGEGRVNLTELSQKNEGTMAEHTAEAGKLEIATKITVAKQNDAFAAARSAFTPVILNTSLDMTAGKLVTTLASVDAASIQSSIISLLAEGELKNSPELSYSKQDSRGKTWVLRLRKVSDTQLRIVVSVEEQSMVEADATTALVVRDIVLNYSFEKAAASSELVLEQPVVSADDDQAAGPQ